MSGTVSGLAAGATFSVQVADGAFSASYTATVNSAASGWTATIPEADAIQLPDGQASVTAFVSAGVQATANVIVAATLPVVTFGVVAGDDTLNSAEADASGGVALSGTVSGLVPGDHFLVTVADSGFSASYTATVGSGGAWTATMPKSDAVKLGNGPATLSAQVVDAHGNVSATATHDFTVAFTGPSLSFDAVAGNDVLNAAEASATAGVALTGGSSGLASGAMFDVTLSDGGFTANYLATVGTGGAWSAILPMADARNLADGPATLSATATDAFGHVSPVATHGFVVAATLPVVTFGVVAGDDTLNSAEANASGGVALGGTVYGSRSGRPISL